MKIVNITPKIIMSEISVKSDIQLLLPCYALLAFSVRFSHQAIDNNPCLVFIFARKFLVGLHSVFSFSSRD